MSQWIKVTDLKGNPILINMEFAISVHKDVHKEDVPPNVVKMKPVSNIMMDKEWGYVVQEDPRLVYDLILETEMEFTYDAEQVSNEETVDPDE